MQLERDTNPSRLPLKTITNTTTVKNPINLLFSLIRHLLEALRPLLFRLKLRTRLREIIDNSVRKTHNLRHTTILCCTTTTVKPPPGRPDLLILQRTRMLTSPSKLCNRLPEQHLLPPLRHL